MIEVKIVADSIGWESGVRLTTFVLTYPRFIHSEFMTHRVFSRNASSSRAIPVKKQIDMVRQNPAIPVKFLKNQKGMQGGEPLSDESSAIAVKTWLEGRDRAVEIAEKLASLEVHKQYANRVLEPYAHISVVCTATDFNNWFALRCHPDAQPEIKEVADAMYELYRTSSPKILYAGQWHLPFITPDDWQAQFQRHCAKYQEPHAVPDHERYAEMLQISVARCARVSYLNHDGTNTTLEQDFELYHRLLASTPMHASPAEHQAMAVGDPNVSSGNFKGWIQFRKTIIGENITEFKK